MSDEDKSQKEIDLGNYSSMTEFRYTFTSNYNIHKSLYGLCFWAPDPLTDRFYYNLSIKESGVQKQRPYKLL